MDEAVLARALGVSDALFTRVKRLGIPTGSLKEARHWCRQNAELVQQVVVIWAVQAVRGETPMPPSKSLADRRRAAKEMRRERRWRATMDG